VTGVVLVAIVALAAGGLVVGFLAIAHVGPFDDTRPPEPSAPPPRRRVTIQTRDVTPQAPVDAPSPRASTKAPTSAVAEKSPRRSAWDGIRHEWKRWKVYRYRHAEELRGRAGWAALVVGSAFLAYLIAHL
jgi:hypothetical protein